MKVVFFCLRIVVYNIWVLVHDLVVKNVMQDTDKLIRKSSWITETRKLIRDNWLELFCWLIGAITSSQLVQNWPNTGKYSHVQCILSNIYKLKWLCRNSPVGLLIKNTQAIIICCRIEVFVSLCIQRITWCIGWSLKHYRITKCM